MSGRAIPGAGHPLPTLRCRECDYSTVYRDSLSRHVCTGASVLTVGETAQKLVDDLSWRQPGGTHMARVVRKLMELLASIRRQPKRDDVSKREGVPKGTNEARLASAEDYLSLLCAKLEIKTHLLVLADDMVNVGACGDAGQGTSGLHMQSTLTRDWSDVQRTIRHEVAHITVHNRPGMGEVPAHGAEFDAALVVEKALLTFAVDTTHCEQVGPESLRGTISRVWFEFGVSPSNRCSASSSIRW